MATAQSSGAGAMAAGVVEKAKASASRFVDAKTVVSVGVAIVVVSVAAVLMAKFGGKTGKKIAKTVKGV